MPVRLGVSLDQESAVEGRRPRRRAADALLRHRQPLLRPPRGHRGHRRRHRADQRRRPVLGLARGRRDLQLERRRLCGLWRGAGGHQPRDFGDSYANRLPSASACSGSRGAALNLAASPWRGTALPNRASRSGVGVEDISLAVHRPERPRGAGVLADLRAQPVMRMSIDGQSAPATCASPPDLNWKRAASILTVLGSSETTSPVSSCGAWGRAETGAAPVGGVLGCPRTGRASGPEVRGCAGARGAWGLPADRLLQLLGGMVRVKSSAPSRGFGSCSGLTARRASAATSPSTPWSRTPTLRGGRAAIYAEQLA